jgi:hypothetical protein
MKVLPSRKKMDEITGHHGITRYRYGTFLDKKLFLDEHTMYISIFLKNTVRVAKNQVGRPGG